MSSNTKQTLVVFGATGSQGGSVAKSILKDPETAAKYHVRCITRDTEKPSAKALIDLGAEVVKADLNDKESLRMALTGADDVFLVTNFWETKDPDVEIQQGKNVADVCKELAVKHLVWSSLPNITKISSGKFTHVYHFDSKAAVEDYIRSLGIPASFFLAGFYMENIPSGMMRKTSPEGAAEDWTFALPITEKAQIPMFAASADTGKYVKAMLLNKEAVLGRQVPGATAYYDPVRIAKEFGEATGKKGLFVSIDPEDFKKSLQAGNLEKLKLGVDEKIQLDLMEGMLLLDDVGYFGGESLEWGNSLVKEPLTTWKEFAKECPTFN
ncbi:NmrA-domain-containing protein [Ascobolus immersus RN42]|uniref:NmrA-like family domain-containing protein 1 n=1 Tax=Ascobolus immersus RN42 TaxID=1160509 RepID=A0A3N4IV40_ASCIM|nr:NmrA-domain-containing protein [Ascobolus immersus RN42]